MRWPQQADHQANAELLGAHLAAGGGHRRGRLTGPKNGDPDEECALRGGDYVHHLVRIARRDAGSRRRAAAPVRRDAERPERVAGRSDQPGAGRASWPDAGDRH